MSPQEESSTEPGGASADMATNGVDANLLMPGILAAGLVSFGGLEREAWPIVPFNTIEVSVAYPGATPEEVEESIVVKIEEQVEALKDVKAVKRPRYRDMHGEMRLMRQNSAVLCCGIA